MRTIQILRCLTAGLGDCTPTVDVSKPAEYADIVIECVPVSLLPSIGEAAVLRIGRTMVALSCNPVSDAMHLVESGRPDGVRILLSTGTLPDLNAASTAA